MLIHIEGEKYTESDTITLFFAEGKERTVDAFDLVLARRALQDAVIARVTPEADTDALETFIYTPMFDERIVIKFDPEGLMFFALALETDAQGSYADTSVQIPIEYEESDD